MKEYLGILGLGGILFFVADKNSVDEFYKRNEAERNFIGRCLICKPKENGLSLDGLCEIPSFNNPGNSWEKYRGRGWENKKIKHIGYNSFRKRYDRRIL